MRALSSHNPIIPHKAQSLERLEMREHKLINSIAKRYLHRLISKEKNKIVYISQSAICKCTNDMRCVNQF